jgi:hypothetical protein
MDVDILEMPCYCESSHFYYQDIGTKNVACKNMILYKHHHDWDCDEDFMCKDCLDNCIGDK